MDGGVERRESSGFAYEHRRFLLRSTKFTQQYSHLYQARLQAVEKRCAEAAADRWAGVPTQHVVAVAGSDGMCVLVGALYKNMKLKPDFLVDYRRELGEDDDYEEPVPFGTSDDDSLSLEDNTGRVELVGEMDVAKFCTGMIVALLGRPQGKKFLVDDWFFPPLSPQRPLPAAADTAPEYIALLSGPAFSAEMTHTLWLELDAVSSFLRGNLGCHEVARNITKLIVAGGLIKPTADLAITSKIKLEMEDHDVMKLGLAGSPMKRCDAWLASIAQSLPVDVMPGQDDPTTAYLPYQPLHPCLFPMTRNCANTACVTSPFHCRVRGQVEVVGTSGENLHELALYTRGASSAELLASLVRCGHIAPTAPDTLPCYPFTGEDPLQMLTPPHVMFAGHAEAFETDLLMEEGMVCRTIAVPDFTKAPGLVLLDINSPNLETIFVPIDVTEA
eukprot:TRINITY_DN19665_c0_g1_i1.p1 TRINITY_DN19665_c0_g1~~TRINITY_DN19665_c0_g1_i1.p1  ORF type:complete len:467 (+),score=147.25 TRINITY_DN19665_c0_g1_i1:68-1402(+)